VKVTLSKSQWNLIGQKTGWIKTSALNISYTGLVPQDSISGNKIVSSQSILSQFQIPTGWTPYANHMTINLGASKDQSLVGQDVEFSIVAIAHDSMVMAAQVQSNVGSINNPPHITIAVNPNGGKPMMSGKLKDWKPINPIQIKGKILEVLQDGTILTNEMKQQDKNNKQQNTQQAETTKKANNPTSIIQANKFDREQAIEFLKSRNIPQQAWDGILRASGL